VDGLSESFEVTLLCRRIVGGVEVSRAPQQPVTIEIGPASRVRFAAWLAGRLAAEGQSWDLVLVQGYALASLACNLTMRWLKRPVVMLVCSPVETYYHCRKVKPDPRKPYRWTEALGLTLLGYLNARLGNRYIVLSEYLARVVRAHGTLAPVDIIPIYGVDTRVFTPTGERRTKLRADLGLPTTGALLLFSSRIAPEKDVDTLLRAISLLRARGRTLWVVNRSGGYREFAAQAAAIGLEDVVLAGDAVEPNLELAKLYCAVDVCVQASRAEGLGFSPLEALACGTPVVAAAVGGLLETIVDGHTGWTYPVGDAEGLASVIEDALDRPEEAMRRALAGQRMVAERFERRRVFGKFEHAIRQLLGTP
jgi:glycosyltransferase involved in cell wall biosynthesis